jgi:hypothetical protein
VSPRFLWIAAVASATIARAGAPLPSPSPPEVFDREVRSARSYLEGWFGTAMAMPPIEINEGPPRDMNVDLPGHYHDGSIRIRPETVRKESELRRVLRHELTHAIIDQKTKGNCPHWLQEGIAQFLDGTDVRATEAWLRRQTTPLTPLFRIEGPFRDRDLASREAAYRESASAVSFLVSRIGRNGLLFLIQRLGEGRPFERALLETGLSYTELQQAWESSLRLPGKTNPQGAAR